MSEPAPRIVRPRTRTYRYLSVVAISGDLTLSEQGEMGQVDDLLHNLPRLQPTLFARQSAADFIGYLNDHFQDNKRWQWRVATHERDIVRPDGIRVATRLSTVIHYFGFKGGNYHKIIDPVSMYGHRLSTVWPNDDGDLVKLLHWAVALRDFCHANRMEIRPTIGSLSAQFLTDRRFYPRRRRKVPMKTNERAREALPGNHYVLTVAPTPEREFTALYLDQHRAHHYHAQVTSMPDSDHLYAYGRFIDLAEITFKSVWPDFYGLYCLALEPPRRRRPSHWVSKLDRAFVFSNELSHLTDMGYEIRGVYAAWGSFRRDKGIARYARWAQKQLDYYGDKPWIKPLLLATYGTLATRPKYGQTIFRLAKNGENVTIVTGHHRLPGVRITGKRKLEPRIANVIHRGMIEAATRSESVGFGQYLTQHCGFRVLSVYADAVIIEDNPDRILPHFPEPWRCKATLNHLQFINQQAFISGEMSKLPGVTRELQQYRQSTSPGYAPRKVLYEAGTDRQIQTSRRI